MDDSISDDINVVSSDEDVEISNVDDDEDDDVEVVDVSFDGAVQLAATGQESPGNDEVVVVDENVVNLVEDSDDQGPQSSGEEEGMEEEEEEGGGGRGDNAENEEARGQEARGEGGGDNAAINLPASLPHVPSAPSSALQPLSSSSSSLQEDQVPAAGPSASPEEEESSSSLLLLARPHSSHSDHPLPPVLLSHGSPLPGPSTPRDPNSSMDDFQIPAHRRPAVSAAIVTTRADDSAAEFRSAKRRRIVTPEKSQKRGGGTSKGEACDDSGEEDDGNHCSICFEPWDNSGRHRLAALKCGHLFGLGCIEKWLKGQGGKCPSCNHKAKVKDIRVIYAKAIKMVDTAERDRALQELEEEKDRRRRAELEAAQARLQCRQYLQESQRLRDQVTRLMTERSCRGGRGPGMSSSSSSSSQAGRSQPSQQSSLQGQFTNHKTVRIFEGGQCRVLAHCPSMAVLVISQPSPNVLFPGFGIKKLSCMDFKTSSYLTLHQKAIRGLTFHPRVDDGILLSVAMDRTVKLTSVLTNSVVQTYTASVPLWSCEWNADDPNCLFVGQQNGVVLEFDTRNTASAVREMGGGGGGGSKSPVVALQYLPRDSQAPFQPGGLIVGQLDRVSFFESKGDNENRLHILPLEGNLTSLNVDVRTRHLLASFRPSAKYPTVRHQLCELTRTVADDFGVGGDNGDISCHVVDTFHGGRSQSLLGRTLLTSHPADPSRLLVVAGDEQSESTHIWDAGTSQLLQRLPGQGSPVDFVPFSYNQTSFLSTLSDRWLHLYTWN